MTRSYPVPQQVPPLSPRLTLPTMYDLPSEDPEEPGLPDEFHDLQPQLLSRTLCLSQYPPDRIFTGSDINLYYDVRHSGWYKRPDWFLALDVPRLYDGGDSRSSYVVWQEGVNPFIVVEILSPGTAKEDLGRFATPDDETEESDLPEAASAIQLANQISKPPAKLEVYERILRIPYYVVFNRRQASLRFFHLIGSEYQEQLLDPQDPRIWVKPIQLGLGIWQGSFDGIPSRWLRWYDAAGNWMLTDTEQAQKEVEQAQVESQRAQSQLRQVVINLLQSGMGLAQVAQITGLSEAQITELELRDSP
jgi:Uma2 family endonuclease